jgi:hypothetical protein
LAPVSDFSLPIRQNWPRKLKTTGKTPPELTPAGQVAVVFLSQQFFNHVAAPFPESEKIASFQSSRALDSSIEEESDRARTSRVAAETSAGGVGVSV